MGSKHYSHKNYDARILEHRKHLADFWVAVCQDCGYVSFEQVVPPAVYKCWYCVHKERLKDVALATVEGSVGTDTQTGAG